jgi:integrase
VEGPRPRRGDPDRVGAAAAPGGRLAAGAPKSDAGRRVIALDKTTITALREHRLRQQAERAAAGTRWAETGYVFTTVTGTPFRPDRMTRLFAKLVAACGLPPVTLHGLRHGAATLALAAGADLKVVQDQLGHSTNELTADTYTSVLPETPHRRRAHRRAPVPRPPAFRPETCAKARTQETSGMGAGGPQQAPPRRLTALRRRRAVGISAISAAMAWFR